MREIDKTLPKDQRILLAAEEVFSRRGYVLNSEPEDNPRRSRRL